jgi:3-phosphoglycerate kinase
MAKADKESKKRPFVFAVPHDVVVSEKIDRTFSTRIVDFSSNSFVDIINYPHRVPEKDIKLKANEMILDIGPFSASFIAGAIQLSKTVVWNGTMGVTETKGLQGPIGPYAHGTQTIIEAINHFRLLVEVIPLVTLNKDSLRIVLTMFQQVEVLL